MGPDPNIFMCSLVMHIKQEFLVSYPMSMVIRHYPIYTPLYMWYLSVSRFKFGCFFLNILPCDFLLCIAFLIELVAAHTSLYVNCAYRHNADIRIHMYVQIFTYVYPPSTYFISLLSHRLMEYMQKSCRLGVPYAVSPVAGQVSFCTYICTHEYIYK